MSANGPRDGNESRTFSESQPHRWPTQGVDKAHHTPEHGNDVAGQNIMATYFAGKFAELLTTLKAIDDGGGRTALFNSSVMLR